MPYQFHSYEIFSAGIPLSSCYLACQSHQEPRAISDEKVRSDHDYSSTGFKVIDDSTFILIETIIPAGAEEKYLPNKEIKTSWKITVTGMIEQVKQPVRGTKA